MSHSQFILSYNKGALGCVVATPKAFAFFFSGEVDQSKVKSVLAILLEASLAFAGVCFLLFLFVPLMWALVGSILVFAACLLVTLHGVAELVISYSLIHGGFFASAIARGALIICESEGEKLPKPCNQYSPNTRLPERPRKPGQKRAPAPPLI
jgi:hypothetical protein